MTKAKMTQFLRYKIKQLDTTMEPDKFYKRVEELFYRLRRIPVKAADQERFDRNMDAWEEHFYVSAQILKFNHEMRKTSVNKKYYKPSLGPGFIKTVYPMLCNDIHFSLLPKKESDIDSGL